MNEKPLLVGAERDDLKRQLAEVQAVAQRMREAVEWARDGLSGAYSDDRADLKAHVNLACEQLTEALAVSPSAALMEFAEGVFKKAWVKAGNHYDKMTTEEAWLQSATRKSLSRAGGEGV